jgi:dTDP-4-dehydrorhamnose 3,5-epimerase
VLTSELIRGKVVQLPEGVVLTDLTMHPDERGVFTEVFRKQWDSGVDPVQWNVVSSNKGVLRGVHVHPRHDDYLVILSGRATVGLHDLRRSSDTHGLAATAELSGDELRAISIPHGVAHGFLFHEPSMHLYAVSHYWDTADEVACHWDDEGLRIDWPFEPSLVSERDAAAPSLADLLNEIESHQPF